MNFNVNEYIDVNDRILRFWSEHPDGRIQTDLMSLPDDFTQCRYKASIYKDMKDVQPAATGWAFEIAGGGGANRTSHEENCETSAIGRALANMGYATSAKDRPSKQEMEKVNRGTTAGAGIRPEPEPKAEVAAPITKEQVNQMGGLMRGLGWEINHRQNWLRKNTENKTIDYLSLSEKEAAKLIKKLEERLDEETQRGLVAPEGAGNRQEALIGG